MKPSSILGLNSRAALFSYPYNKKRGKKVAKSKNLTNKALKKLDIPTPRIFKKFKKPSDVLEFNWDSLPAAFVVKPNKGLGGDGILVVKKKSKDGTSWITTTREKVNKSDLQLHVLDILEGAYSQRSSRDMALIQEYVPRHKAFRKYAYRGTPDIRIIIFNYVPVMAMLRLPTRESGGRANLHQGAIGVGVDIASGITTHAVWHGEPVNLKPGTKRKLHGIRIPHWKEILSIAARCQDIEGLGYLGVDIFLHPERGPMVVEVNSQPGLQIQLANNAGLRKRLDRVDDLPVKTPERGVKISEALFATHFTHLIKNEEGVKTVSVIEDVIVKGKGKKKRFKARAKIDSGAWRTSVDRELAESLGLLVPSNILWERQFRSALGKQKRTVIGLTYWISGRRVDTVASVTTRKNLRFKVIIGRKDLVGFLINPRKKKEK